VLSCLALLAGRAAAQGVLFDFDAASPGAGLPLELTAGGITARLTATGAGFSIQRADVLGFTPAGFSGLCLYPNALTASDLRVDFSRKVTSFSILTAPEEFGCDTSATMRVTGYLDGAFAATSTTTAPVPGTWPTGTATLGAAKGFNAVVVHYETPPSCHDHGPVFMADVMTVTPLDESLFVPIVLSSAGAADALYTTELTLTNRGAADAILTLDYAPAFGGGAGQGTDLSAQASVAIENALLFDEIRTTQERSQTLSRRLVEVQEEERRAIARELHDETGQSLTGLLYSLRLLERGASGEGPAGQIHELERTVQEVLENLHRMAANLRPASLDHLGLEAALRQHLAGVERKTGLTVRFRARGLDGDRMPPMVEATLYRVVQEAMTNVVRHARATSVDVLAERKGEFVSVLIEDDGVGFDPAESGGTTHLGLIGMKERAETLGGTFVVESAPGAGTTVVVEVPCADPNPDRR